jgi:magnesium-protoporphyrin O-methyltransferase
MPEREPTRDAQTRPCTCGCVNTFSSKEAEQDLAAYRRDGAGEATQALIDAICAEGIEGASLLDVGGGIGAIQLELLAAGLGRSEAVEASEGYVPLARAEAARRGFADRATHRFGTLADLADEVGPADIVTLDKVVCCNADLPLLLGDVVLRARRMIGLVYPRERWWNGLGAALLAAWNRLTGDPTRWYVHPEAEVDGILRSAGFERRDISRTFIWQVALYVRPPSQPSVARPS